MTTTKTKDLLKMENNKEEQVDPVESLGTVRPSISVRLIRHAESNNNQVYRDARAIFRGGTPEFDERGWNDYVDQHRDADPGLSDLGEKQAQRLADWLMPHLWHQASHPVRIITSPMRRTLETIIPTLKGLQRLAAQQQEYQSQEVTTSHVIVNAFYYESEGCYIRDVPEEGMNPANIGDLLQEAIPDPSNLEFEGFPDPQRGWFVGAKGAESRAEAEDRAAKFYVWLCHYLDHQLLANDNNNNADDVFDAGVFMPEEEGECEHDKISPRKRRRRTTLLLGHGDFMSLVLKRIIAGYGHSVEQEGIPHRSAFVHFNTGITELEYFGHGRFLVMNMNQTPHLHPSDYSELRAGGSLKDGWAYLVPDLNLNAEVSVAFSDEDMEEHVREQSKALRALYLSSSSSSSRQPAAAAAPVVASKNIGAGNDFSVEERGVEDDKKSGTPKITFVVKRGLEVVGVASYCEETGHLSDLALRPVVTRDANKWNQDAGVTLLNAVKQHARSIGRSDSLIVHPQSLESKRFFKDMGFQEIVNDDGEDSESSHMELRH